jgi:PAS domain S-box-containing protein
MVSTKPQIKRSHLELLYHISRELSSRLDLRELIERILRLTSESLSAENGSLILIGDDGQVYDAALILNGALVPDAEAQLGPQLERGLAGWALRQRQVIVSPDTASDPRWQPAENSQPAESKSALSAPLIFADRVLGVLTLVHPQPSYFGEAHQQLLKAIAEQAAVAVENARLLRESRRQTQNLRSLVEVAQVLSSTLDPDKLLQLLLSETVRLLHLEAASIALTDMEKQELVFQVAAGSAAAKMTGLRLKLGQGIAGWVAQTGQPIIVPEAHGDPRFYAQVDQQTGFYTRAVLCAPIKFEGYTIGVVEGLNPAPGTFDRNTLPLLTGIASLAGNALAHAQQFSFTETVKDRYAGLFEDSFDPIIITDLKGIITDVNHKAAIALGYTRAEMMGMSINAIHTLGLGPLSQKQFSELARGIEMAFESHVTTKDGRDIPVEAHAKRISTTDDEFIQWIERDISERLHMEEMREDLISMIFHDLRSPLGNVISSLTLLQSSTSKEDDVIQSVLGIAVRSSQHLSRLVDSLLDLRRLESGQATLHRTDISISALILEAAEQVHPLAEGKGITLRFDLPLRLPVVSVDADMIRRVLINLIENAVKYMPGEGTITAAARVDGGHVVVSIADTGLGIPESERSRIFDKFTRLQRSGTVKGIGLGLAFCKLAIEAHQGKIWVDAAPVRGAVFSFTLPAKD